MVEEKIGILVERYCRNRSHLADMIGVTPQAVNNWIYRDHIPHRGIAAIIARFPQVDRAWLRGGSLSAPSGPLPLPADEDENEEMPAPPATNGLPTSGEPPQAEANEGLVPLQLPRSDVKYAFLCHGDSMLPRIQDGDYVCVSDAIGRYEEFQQGIPYLVQTTDGRFMVKMVQDPGPSSPFLLLSTENPNYQLADGGKLAKHEFYTAYRVIMIMRGI